MSKSNIKKKIADGQLLPGVFVSLAISFLIFLYAPVDLFCANVSEFWFDFSTLLLTAFGMFAVCFAVLFVVYLIALLIHPYVYRIVLAGGLVLFICTYVQGNFMIDRLPTLDGTSIWWGKYDILRKDTLILWAVVSTVVLVAMIVLKRQKFINAVMFVSGCMTLMLLVTACSTVLTSGALQPKLHLHVSVEEEFELSQNENFVILVLDTADSREFSALLEEHPEYRDVFADFTYFENTTGTYTSTLNAIPFILSGEWYENEGSFQEYLDRVYREAPLWNELESRDYQINLYEDDIRAQDSSIVDNFDNVYFTKVRPSSYLELAKQELKLVGFRYAPYDLKRYCVIKEVYFNELRVSYPEGSDAKAFTADNTAFKEDLATQGVSMDLTGNQFRFIHLNGAHAPFIYDKDANIIGVEHGSYRQSMEASITLAANYIQALKDSGAYDNTALIVMADHGYNGIGEKEEDFLRQAALLLVKGRAEHHDTMQTSEAPVSYEDLQSAYVRLLDGAQSDAVFDWKEGDVRERRFLEYAPGSEKCMTEYIQTGHAQDMTTMVPTGRVFTR